MLDRFYDKDGNSYYIDDEEMTPDILDAVMDFLQANQGWALGHFIYAYEAEDSDDGEDGEDSYWAIFNTSEW